MNVATKQFELAALIARQKKQSFRAEYQARATDEEALAIMVAEFFGWDGAAIARTFIEALGDANFHNEASQVTDLLKGVLDL